MLIGIPNRVALPVDGPDGPEELYFTFPATGDPDFETGKKKLLDERQVMRGRRVKNRATDARVAFFDKFCQRVEGLEAMLDGERVDLMQAYPDRGWVRHIGVEFKTSVVFQNFEEKKALSAEDREDLAPASDED